MLTVWAAKGERERERESGRERGEEEREKNSRCDWFPLCPLEMGRLRE